MNQRFVRWLNAAGCVALLGGLLTFGTGCGALAAAANPKVAWALNDPAPMSVVVRRADVAENTAKEVDRLLTETPANDDSAWIGKVAPEKEDATKQLGELRQHDLYVGGARVVAAEVWAKSLHSLESSKKDKPADAAAQPVVAAAVPAPSPEPQPVAKKEAKNANAKATKKGKGDEKKAKADDKPVEATKPADAADAAPAPAPAAPAGAAKYSSLLAAVDNDLGAEWQVVMEKKRGMGDLKTDVAFLESQNDDKNVPESQKKENKVAIRALEKQIDALEKEANHLEHAFIPKAKAAASKAAPEVRDRVGPALVNLRQAVDDANIANGAAALRYPMAVTSVIDSAKQMVRVYVADVIEEKTGKRPSTQSLEPGVTMEGGKVAVTINGLSPSDMGKINIGDLTSEVASRTTKWVKRATTLMGTISSTKDVLSLEDDVLGALIDGFKASGWAPPAATTIPEAPPAGGAQGGRPNS
jgi:hypothetical protein